MLRSLLPIPTALLLAACSAQDGAQGPAGPAGPPGASAPAPSPPDAGTGRLRVVWTRVRSAGIDAVVGQGHLVDSARDGEVCAPGVASDNVQRCMPVNVWDHGTWWADAACTAPYAHGVGRRDGKMVYVVAPGRKVFDTRPPTTPIKVFAWGYVTTGTATSQACVPVAPPTHVELLEVGTEVGPTSFAEVSTSGE
jgi:hypothetical protein